MSEIKDKIMMETKCVCDIMEKLNKEFKRDLDDIQNFDVEEAGKVADMIKDFAEAKKNIVECVYKEHILEEMEGEKETKMPGYRPMEPMGYNDRRHSTGRYAPEGRGNVYGYENPAELEMDANQRMGYRAKKGGEHFDKTVEQIRDMWKDADPALKSKMRNEIANLVNVDMR